MNSLAWSLSRDGNLPVAFAAGGEVLEKGRVLLAPPDQHLLVEGDRTRLSTGARENGFRPAINPLFRSAARSAGPRVVGVVLSGLLDDGAAGLREVKRHGGTTIVQDYDEAVFPDMPLAASRGVVIDHVLSAESIAEWIERHAGEGPRALRPAETPSEPGYFGLEPTELSCPDCGGVLRLAGDAGGPQEFVCHVGHRFGPDSLLADQG